ncbi:TerD family protein [Streptomyces aureus]|uniref:TerD family protein n=1 Tax=Streptomyces aureus TaxID=193461 RepID=UPI00099DD8E9|nr:TerD family protein [Streptomyces aureus]
MAVQSAAASVLLRKGGNVEVTTQDSGITLAVSLGWQTPDHNGSDFEVDASAIGTAGGTVYSDDYFVFFNNLRTPDGSILHSGEPVKSGDQARILVDLAALPADLDRIVFPVSIYEADYRGQNFSQVRGAYIRIAPHGGHEIARYSLSAETATAVLFGELYRFHGKWKFRAVGHGYASGLRGIALDFGVNV